MATLNYNIESGSKVKSIQERGEQAIEATANQVFLDQNLESDDKFDNKSDDESNDKSDNESDDKSDDKFDKASDENKKCPAKVGFILAYSTIYAREKLIRILSGEVVVPKKQ